ncbi:MAG: type III-A CRISPR-associated protein Cas10/Csm1 [Promethearchaeota archaeon]
MSLISKMALLHDIGKFIQRCSSNPNQKTHQEFGYDCLERLNFKKEVSNACLYHHSRISNKKKESLISIQGETFKKNLDKFQKNLISIVWEADQLSSGERVDEEQLDFFSQRPLRSIFSLISSTEDSKIKELDLFNKDLRYVPYRPLFIGSEFHFFFPKEISSEHLGLQKKLLNPLYDFFNNDIVKENINIILKFLENYLTFIPSKTTKEGSDISLFDHLKTTAMIAHCLYMYCFSKYNDFENIDLNINKLKTLRKEPIYLLIGGDLSGIQSFISNVSSYKALRMLRAKSLYLDLLMHDIVSEILNRLKLSRVHLLFCSGGHFFIIAPNTNENIQKLNSIRIELLTYLFKNLNAKIFVSLDWVELNGEVFIKKEIDKYWEILSQKLNKNKKQKFKELIEELEDNFFIQIKYEKNKNQCELCGEFFENLISLHDLEEDFLVCKFCFSLFNFSREILKGEKDTDSYISNFILRISNKGRINKKETYKFYKEKNSYFLEFPFSKFIFIKSANKNILTDPLFNNIELKSIFLLNDFISLNQILILQEILKNLEKDFDFDIIFLPLYSYLNDLDKISEESIGINYIGTLTVDVDDLGKIFIKGIPEKLRTISRLSNLSRLIEYFFKLIIPIIMNKRSIPKDILTKNPELLYRDSNIINEPRKAVIIYSGGDDLLITGAWNDVLASAFDIRECFNKYCGLNPHISISSGFVISHRKLPIYINNKLVHELIDKAKDYDNEKNKICYFNETIIEWEDLIESVNEILPLFIKMNEKDRIELRTSKSFLNNIQRILKYNNQSSLSNKKINLLIYMFSRNNGFKKDHSNQFDSFLRKIISINNQQNQEYKKINSILQWIDYLTRYLS